MTRVHLLRERGIRLACGARSTTHRTSMATDDVTCLRCKQTVYFAQIRAEEQGNVTRLEAR